MSVSAVKAEPAPAEAAPPVKSKKGLIKIVLIAVLVIAAGGGGAWWYLGHKGGDAAQEAKHEPAKPPVFYPLETFTVNLVLVDNPQFLQTGITLKVADNAVLEELKSLTPLVRDRILMLMSSRKASELLTVEGKRQLGEDIVDGLNAILRGGESRGKSAAGGDAAKGGGEKAAADAEDEADAEPGKGEKAAKGGKGADEKSGEGPVQAVLFTTFIIQ